MTSFSPEEQTILFSKQSKPAKRWGFSFATGFLCTLFCLCSSANAQGQSFSYYDEDRLLPVAADEKADSSPALVPPSPLDDERRKEPKKRFIQPMHGTEAVIDLIIGQGRLLSTKAPLAKEGGAAVIAVGDPAVLDFEVLPNPRLIRIIGKRAGITDLTFVTSEGEAYVFEVRVNYDLELMQAQLAKRFPDALIRITQIREHLILEGQARTDLQIMQIEQVVRALVASVNPGLRLTSTPTELGNALQNGLPSRAVDAAELSLMRAGVDLSQRPDANQPAIDAQVINLMTVPGIHQVLLQVRVAELNRTGMRRIGADTFFEFGAGNIIGTKIAGSNLTVNGVGNGSINGLTPGANTTGFGLFPNAGIEIMLEALQQNSLVRILAEPNLVALSGHEASFLAGGEFPVPVPQGGQVGGNVTVRFKDFGVQLNFVPHIMDDEIVRLEVRPEVSTIDESLGTTLVVGGQPVPGVNTRRVHTTVEMREGETLALAGLLQVTLDGQTEKIPGLGDLPYLGPMFSNNTHKRVERELLVLVTPYLIQPLQPNQVPPLPGEGIIDPTNREFFIEGRIIGRHAFGNSNSQNCGPNSNGNCLPIYSGHSLYTP